MRLVLIREPQTVAPFNQRACDLYVLNKPLSQWQRDLLAPYTTAVIEVKNFSEIPPSEEETLVLYDNLWFDEHFLADFLEAARSKGRPTRAAFRQTDHAYLQQGLPQITRSYEKRGDLYYVNLWYFPAGMSTQVEPTIISSEAQQIGYYSMPDFMTGKSDDLVWWLPKRAMCPLDTWVHVFFINIVFGVFAEAYRTERRSADPMFRLQASVRSLIERKKVLESSAYVTIGENCSIDDSAIIQGPVVIGDNVTIGPGCVITQSIIGDNVTLAHGNHLHMSVVNDNCFLPWGASVHFSVMMEHSSLGNSAVADMSVIGRNSYVGSGTVFTEFNLLASHVTINVDYEPVELNMPVLGVCVGHNCRVGAGLVVYPGRKIESDVVLMPSPTRRIIMNDISYEESDHHATPGADVHPRQYPRQD